tara:strand:- start:1347 stop:1802 length:456 start_codon:yes stop_codon:yes gene_type:complete
MGIEIASELISANHDCAEQRLWRHVLLNAFEDTRITQSDRKSSIYKMEAHEWIVQENQDFEWICWQCGWDPIHVKEQYFKAVRSGLVTFNNRQIKWLQYYRLYQELRKEKDSTKRIPLRKKVEAARWAVFETTTALVKRFIVEQNLLGAHG